MIRCAPLEPSMDVQMKAFGSKKTFEISDTTDDRRHTQVERCFLISWWKLVLQRTHDMDCSTFNLCADEDGA